MKRLWCPNPVFAFACMSKCQGCGQGGSGRNDGTPTVHRCDTVTTQRQYTPGHQSTTVAGPWEAGSPEASTPGPSDECKHPELCPLTPAVPLVGDSRGLMPVPLTESWTPGC